MAAFIAAAILAGMVVLGTAVGVIALALLDGSDR
jgi:hypothetical protein